MAELSPSNSVTNQIRKSVKRKKIIMRSIVGGVSALILGLGAGFIAIGVNRPYTTIDLNKTNLFIPDGFDKTINSRTTKEWTEPLTLEVYFNNHHQTEKNKYPDKMTNEWFDEHHGVDDIYWTLEIDEKHHQYLDPLRIDPESGILKWTARKTEPAADKITIWISVELMIHGFETNTTLKSNPIDMTITASARGL